MNFKYLLSNKKELTIYVLGTLLIFFMIFMLIFSRNVFKSNDNHSYLLSILKNYDLAKDGEDSTQSENVKFDAYVLRDIDGDGKVEKIRGTCNKIGDEETLYILLNVNSQGYLKNGKITVNGKNFYLSTALVEDNVISENYISNNTKLINLNDINSGTTAILKGQIKSGNYSYLSSKADAIQNGNINNYSIKDNKIKLSGIYVDETGKEINIEKEVNLAVDWYGEIEAQLYKHNRYQSINIKSNIFDINVGLEETKKELMLSKVYIEGVLPLINGQSPVNVNMYGNGTYDPDTRKFVIEKQANLDINNNIINEIYDINTFNINVEYPVDSINQISESQIIPIAISGYYEGYNNTNIYENGYLKSNVINDTLLLNINKREEIVPDYVVNSYIDKYDMSKINVINAYENKENVVNDRYEVIWSVDRTKTTENVNITIEQYDYDKIDTLSTSSIKNIGIYFSGNIEELLASDGVIKLYNNETNELIKEFTNENWNEKYLYEENIRKVKIEIYSQNSGEKGNIKIHNIKEINSIELSNEVTLESLLNSQKINNFVKFVTSNITSKLASVYYRSPLSSVGITISKTDLSTQIKNNVDININVSSLYESSWKDGKFLIKLPEELTNVEICGNAKVSNSQVEISSLRKYIQNGNTFIEVETLNEQEIENYNIVLNLNLQTNSMIPSVSKNIEIYAYNPKWNLYSNYNNDTYDINLNGNNEDRVAFSSTMINLVAPTNLITTEKILDSNANVLVGSSQSLEITKEELGEKRTVQIELLNNFSGGTVENVKIVGKIPNKDNTFILSGKNMGSNYTTLMSENGILIPEELNGKIKIYYSEEDNVKNDINDLQSKWIENPSDFSNVKSYLIDFMDLSLNLGDRYTFTYDIYMPENVEYEEKCYSTHAVFFNIITAAGKLPQELETSKLGIIVAKKFDMQLTDLEEMTEETIPGIRYNVSDGENNIIVTTNENGKAFAKDLYVEREYTITKEKTPSNYELDENVRKIKIHDNGVEMTIENIQGEFKNQEIQFEENKNILKLELENTPKYIFNLNKQEKESNKAISDAKFLLEGKGIAEDGAILQTNINGNIKLSGLYLNEIYTLQEIYVKGYVENPEEIKFKVIKEDNMYKLDLIQGEFTTSNVIKQTGSIPVLNAVIENEKIGEYTLDLIKYQKNSDNVISNVKFNLKGKWISEAGENYITNNYGQISLKLYEGYEYTLKEIETPNGYVIDDKEIKFIATRNSDGKLEFSVTQGGFKDEPKVENDVVNVRLENEKIFTITKEDEDTGELLKGVKFAIYEVNRDENGIEKLSEAKDVNDNIVGKEETINGIIYRILETDENGTVSERLRPGLYKAIEVQALEGYFLGDLEDHTYYFGINESQIGNSYITLDYENDNIVQRSIIQTTDGGYIGVFDSIITKYNSNFEIQWQSQSSNYAYYVKVLQTNDGGYIALSSDRYYEKYKCSFITKYDSLGNIQWEKNLLEPGTAFDFIITKSQDIVVVNTGYAYENDEVLNCYIPNRINVTKYDIQGNLLFVKELLWGTTEYQSYIKLFEDDNENLVLYNINPDTSIDNLSIMKLDKDGNRLYYRDYSSYISGTSYFSSRGGAAISSACIDNDGGYIFVGRSQYRAEDNIYAIHPTNGIGQNSAIIFKCNKNGELQWIKENSSETVYLNILKLDDGSFVIQSEQKIYKYSSDFEIEGSYDFGINCADDNVYGVPSYNFSLLNSNKVLVSKMDGYVESAPTSILKIDTISNSIVQKQEILVYNKLKEYTIQTFAGEGGTISGVSDEVYETVKYGKNAIKEISVTPNDGYKVLNITVNGEDVEFNEQEDGSVILEKFENITQNKVILATFIEEEKYGDVTVKHYKSNEDKEIAKSEKIRGEVGESYTTQPKNNILRYSVNIKNLPANATGTISTNNQEVIYYYDQEPIKITTKYINLETNEKMQEDIIEYKNVGENYVTKEIENIPEGYELASYSENKEGTITGEEENSEITVYYYYRLKKYKIKTQVVGIGGTISGEGLDAFEIVKHGQNSTKEIIVKPDDRYEVLTIKENGNNLQYKLNDNGSVNLSNIINITEDKVISVEFKLRTSKVTIEYIEKDTNQKLMNSTQLEGNVGEQYTAPMKDISEYKIVSPFPTNSVGKYTKDEITVTYYYQKTLNEVLVKYLEKDTNNILADFDLITGKIGDTYETQAKEIEGYRLIESETRSKNGTIKEGVNEVIYYYERITENEQITENTINPSTGNNVIVYIFIIINIIAINLVLKFNGKEGK